MTCNYKITGLQPLEYGVDRDSYIPYYIQVKEIVLERIKNNEWKVGEQLPAESQLCAMFDVSRTVIRQALQELENRGVVIRKKGKGTFVARPKISGSLVQRLTGLHENMAGQGKTVISQVLKQAQVPASPKVARYLGVAPGAAVVQIDRLRFVQDEPIVLLSAFYPAGKFASLLTADLEGDKSLYAYLEGVLGVKVAHGFRTIEAVSANEYEARLLKIERGSPLILLDSVACDEDGVPVEYYHGVHRGDRLKFEVEVVRDRERHRFAPNYW
jgi:GntR family transcriptional regulator